MDWLFLLKPLLLVRVLRSPSLFISGSVYRGPSSFTHNTKSHFDQVVDLGEHDNLEIKRAVLPQTELKYERTLRIYNQLVPINVNSALIMMDTKCFPHRFLKLHP